MVGEARDRSPERFQHLALSIAFPPHIAIIESRTLVRECLGLCLEKKLRLPVLSYTDVRAMSADPAGLSACIVILSGPSPDIEKEQADLFQELSSWGKDVPVVVFSDDERRHQIATSLRCGAKGYIPSDTPLEVAARGIKLVLVGGVFLPANVIVEPEKTSDEEVGPKPLILDFSPRENDVARALLKGISNKLIAYELGMSESSVKTHIRSVMRKLNANNRTEAVIRIVEALRAEGLSML